MVISFIFTSFLLSTGLLTRSTVDGAVVRGAEDRALGEQGNKQQENLWDTEGFILNMQTNKREKKLL